MIRLLRYQQKFFFFFSIYCYLLIAYVAWHFIGLVGKVFANGLEDQGSILGRIIPKTLKIVLDTSLFNTQHYKVCIKGKVEQSKERSSALPYTSMLKREPSGHSRLWSPTFYIYIYIYMTRHWTRG